MGRKAGVTPEQTRSDLLAAAARVFALKGYDGATIADITDEAGLSSGAIYAHYDSKAELFAAVLQAHGQKQYADVMGREAVRDVADFVAFVGSTVDRRPPRQTALVIEAMVASKRDPEVAELVNSWLTAGEERLARSVQDGQAAGLVDRSISPRALSRFATMVGLGSFLTAALDAPAVDHDDWSALIDRVVDSLRTDKRPAPPKPRPAAAKRQ